MKKYVFTCLLFLAACAPAITPTPTPQIITIYASPVTQPWLADAYQCAQENQLVLSSGNDPAQAEIAIRMGEPDKLNSPAYQIGHEDLLIATNGESPLQNLTADQVQALFSEGANNGQAWVFAPSEDIQQIFDREIMQNAAFTSQARIALSPQQMADALTADNNSFGILPRHWKNGTLRELFNLGNIPVLALTKSEPQGSLKILLDCLQKKFNQ